METINLTKFQILFIESACAVKEAVIFLEDLTEEKFISTYGVSKKKANKEIQALLDTMIKKQRKSTPNN